MIADILASWANQLCVEIEAIGNVRIVYVRVLTHCQSTSFSSPCHARYDSGLPGVQPVLKIREKWPSKIMQPDNFCSI